MKQSFDRLLLGRTLAERYEIEEVMGSGGMSVVYGGRDRTLGRAVAIKVVTLPADQGESRTDLRARLRREAASAARIPSHPNVVQIYDYGTDAELDLDFIVMELLRGQDLKELLDRGAPSPEEALRILQQAARGLAAGHRAGIVHRDVKPGNILLTGEGEVKTVRILDFGIAKPMAFEAQDDLTRTGQLAYSPAYASPEQLWHERTVTPSADVYQLGLIAYEMLAAARPFDDGDRLRIAAGEDIALPVRGGWRDVPEPIRAVVERSLRTRPEDRFADAAEFAEVLDAARSTPVPPSPAQDDPDEATQALDPREARIVAVPAPVAPPAEHPGPPPPIIEDRAGSPRPRSSRSGSGSTARWAIPAALLALVAIFVLRAAMGPDGPDDTGVGAAATVETDAESTAASPAAGGEGAAGAAPSPDVEAEVTARITDLNNAWVEGDIRRHVAHYASRVDYYNSRRLPRSGVRRDRQRDLRRYDERQIRLHSQKVELLDPERVRVLVDKSWRFNGDDHGERSGRGLQEYVLKQDDDDGKWYVVSEQLLQETERRRPATDR